MLDKERYSRQLALPGFSGECQEKLQNARIAIIGCGGLGTPAALYLVAAGVGQCVLIDDDQVGVSNLHRQVAYRENDIGKNKVDILAEQLHRLNSTCELVAYCERLSVENAPRLLNGVDVIVDCTDNFQTRYLVCDVSIRLKIPVVYGAIHQYEGQVAVFNYSRDVNYRDLYMEPPVDGTIPNCEIGGVLGSLAGIVGSMQANETIKLLTGIGELLDGKVCYYDANSNRTHIFVVNQNPANTYRGANVDKIEWIDYDRFCGTKKEKQAVMKEITVQELKAMMDAQEDFQLIDVREPAEFNEINLGALLIPMNHVPERLNEIAKDKKVVVHCRSGARSANVIQYLEAQHGYSNLSNLRGGILAWDQLFGKH